MKFSLAILLSTLLISCSNSDKVVDVDKPSKSSIVTNAENVMSLDKANKSQKKSCDLSLNKGSVNFGSSKVTSRAFRRLRLKSALGHTITKVSSIPKPFGYYNNIGFPGEATYHDYSLCAMNESSKDCSINLEFRPRAVEAYIETYTINYKDGKDNDCSVKIRIKGVSTDSYLGKDSSDG